MADELDWDPIRALARRVSQGGDELVLTDDIRALLECTAAEVGIGASEAAELLATDDAPGGVRASHSRGLQSHGVLPEPDVSLQASQ
ncbi:hypothetical protein MFU01_24250 [Myxococcus fulvus]|uniref:DUSAM domain-containing protein n=1 Tax=Myxococcus fulvus TaxID=33 RepID=A0A511T1Y9_MYXFU|nr:hypothetical protein MFU01_24250 [Myxococcus fulvus]